MITNGFCLLWLFLASLLFSLFGVIESITECLAPITTNKGCTYQCKSPEYAFMCEDDGVRAIQCNGTCPGHCTDTLCKKMDCADKKENYEQVFVKLCQGRSMQMHQGESSKGLRFRQSANSRESSTGNSIYMSTLLPILAGGLVMGAILVLVRLCGRRGQVRMVEAPPPPGPETIAQPQIRYPCQILPMSFSSLPSPLYPINPQFLGQNGQFPNIQLAQVAGMSPIRDSKSPISTKSNQPLLTNEVRPSTSTSTTVVSGTPKKIINVQPNQDQYYVESDFTDLPPAYEDVVFSTHPTIKEDDRNKPKSEKQDKDK